MVKQRPRLKEDEFLGKVVLITGASSGIGEAAALEFARHKAKVILLVRCLDRGEAACNRIRAGCPTADLQLHQADVSLVSSVANFCDSFGDKVDILVNNAGVFGCPYSQTSEGIEYVLAANHVGHFLLTCVLLAGKLLSDNARVILVTGALYTRGSLDPTSWNAWTASSYNKMLAYSNSKMAICLFALWLRSALRRLVGSSAKVFAVHPGVVATGISRHLLRGCLPPCAACLRCCMSACMMSPSNGCQGILLCASDNCDSDSGSYFNKCRRERWCRHILDDDLVARSWDFTYGLVEQAAACGLANSPELLEKLMGLRHIPRDSLAQFLL